MAIRVGIALVGKIEIFKVMPYEKLMTHHMPAIAKLPGGSLQKQ